MMDPSIRLQPRIPLDPQSFAHVALRHPRIPDVGTAVLVSVPSNRAGTENPLETEEYYGEYLGHGQCKTAFELKSMTPAIENQSARFHGKVLKIARANDMEPSVFRVASTFGVTTSILYEAVGVDAASGNQFHCWITARIIPLDEVCRYDDTINSRCSLAAFCCILRAAQQELYLSDCDFRNFGLRVTEDATEHAVVIIDAGVIIGSGHLWNKSRVNAKVMKRFWQACDKESATNRRIQAMWNNAYTLEDCLQTATEAWQYWPFLTKSSIWPGDRSFYAIWRATWRVPTHLAGYIVGRLTPNILMMLQSTSMLLRHLWETWQSG